MKIGTVLLLCCIGVFSYSSDAVARIAISVAKGHGTKQVQAKRLSIQRAWSQPYVTANNRAFAGYWELGFTRMTSKKFFSRPTNENLRAFTLATVFRLSKRLIYPIYLDLGIGLAHLSNREIATRDLGTKILFEDRLGVGVLIGKRQQFEFGYRVLHFSNAYLAKKNQSLNLHMLVLGYWFN